MDLTGQAVHIRDSSGICFNSFYYRSHILAVQRMLCLRMLPVNAGKMHQKFVALGGKAQVVQTVFLIGKKRPVDPLLEILSLFRVNEKVRSFPAYFPDVIRQCSAEGQESGPPAFGVVPVAVRRVGGDQDPFARIQDDVLPGQSDRSLPVLRLEPVVQGKAFWTGNGFLRPAVADAVNGQGQLLNGKLEKDRYGLPPFLFRIFIFFSLAYHTFHSQKRL